MKPFFFIAFVFSILFVLIAPNCYDYEYCRMVFVYSVIICLIFLYYQSRQEGFLNFHSMFVFSFICVNYFHSVFIYPDDVMFYSLHKFSYNPNIIPYSLSIAQLGLMSYILGVTSVYKIKVNTFVCNYTNKINGNIISTLTLLVSFSLFFYVFFILRIQGFHLYPRLMVLIVSLLFVSFYINSIYSSKNIHDLFTVNKKNIIAILLFVLSQLYLGSRAEVIFLVFMLLGLINRYYYRFSFIHLSLFIFIGVLLFSIITLTRVTDINFVTSSFFDVLEYGWDMLINSGDFVLLSLTDFVVNSRNLYDGISYTQMHGFLYGQSYVPYLFSFIPYGSTFLTPLILNKNIDQVSTAQILTNNINANYGIGTNVIADIYMNFSVYGVMLLMFILGLSIQKSKQSNSIINQLFYFSVLGYALYIPRASIISFLDIFIFNIFLYLFFNKFLILKKTYGSS